MQKKTEGAGFISLAENQSVFILVVNGLLALLLRLYLSVELNF